MKRKKVDPNEGKVRIMVMSSDASKDIWIDRTKAKLLYKEGKLSAPADAVTAQRTPYMISREMCCIRTRCDTPNCRCACHHWESIR